MKKLKFYCKLIWSLLTNIDRQVFIVMDDSGSNSFYKIEFIKYSLHIMILFGIDVTIIQDNKKYLVSENIDIINFMKEYYPNCGCTNLYKHLIDLPRDSFVYVYSDFMLDQRDDKVIKEFNNRILVSKADYTPTTFKNEINYI